MNYHKFCLFITCMLAEYEKEIIAGIIGMGYKVGALNKKPTLQYASCSNVLISISVESKNETNPIDLVNQVRDFLIDRKILFYSIVSSQMGGTAWNLGNINLKELPKRKTKPSNGNLYHLNTGKGPFSKDPNDEKTNDE